MELWLIISIITLIFTIPVLSVAYYWLYLFINSVRYPKDLANEVGVPNEYQSVSILVASFNEKFVIANCLESIKNVDYPHEKIQVIVADDSSDETTSIIENKLKELKEAGINSILSKRNNRNGNKSGALNNAIIYATGKLVLLIDSDSVLLKDSLTRGVSALVHDKEASFVSFRVGHYNRELTVVTRLFALSQDLTDTVTKMGSYRPNTPFSLQGGFTLIYSNVLREVGLWNPRSITEDADLSTRLYLAGKKGIYLSNVRIMSEDPQTLETWKKQSARVNQGWSMLMRTYWKRILTTKKLPLPKRIAFILFYLSPFSNFSWIVVSFLSAMAVIFGLTPPSSSIFNNPVYVSAITLPAISFLLSGVYALKVQNIMTAKNLAVVPLLSYTTACMMVLGAIGFISGIAGKTGNFFRTPKTGGVNYKHNDHYFVELSFGKGAVTEFIISVIGLVLAILILKDDVIVLGLNLLGFSVLTLKSMNLSRLMFSHNIGGRKLHVNRKKSPTRH